MFDAIVLPRLRAEFGEHIPGDILGDLSAAIFSIIAGNPVGTITKGTILATVDNVIRDYKEGKTQ